MILPRWTLIVALTNQISNIPLNTDNKRHSEWRQSHIVLSGDSMTMEDPDNLDLCTIVWAAVTYVVANLEDKLPRAGDYPQPDPSSASYVPSHLAGVIGAAFVCFVFIRRQNWTCYKVMVYCIVFDILLKGWAAYICNIHMQCNNNINVLCNNDISLLGVHRTLVIRLSFSTELCIGDL